MGIEWQRRRKTAWGAASLLLALLLVAAPAVAALDFSSPMTLSNGDSGGAMLPQAMVTSGGRAYVAWVDGFDIVFTRSRATSGSCGGPAGLEFEPVQVLAAGVGNEFFAPSVAMAANDSGVYVAWEVHQGDILFARSTDRGAPGSWGDPVNLSQSAGASTGPSVVADGTGVFVVWQENSGSTGSVQIAQSTNGGVDFSKSTVFTANASGFFQPSVASSGSAVHVVWNAGLQGIQYKRISPPGSDAAGAPVSSLTKARGISPRIAASGSQVTAAWAEGRNIKARTKTDGLEFGEEELVNSSTDSVSSLALSLGAGQFVAWEEFGIDLATFTFRSAVRYKFGADPAATLSSGDPFPVAPSVGQDGRTLFVAAWQEDGTDSNGDTVPQVKLVHTGGTGSGGGEPMTASAWVKRKGIGLKMGAQDAWDADDEPYPPKGPRVNVYIELADGSADTIDVSTLRLNGEPPLPGRTRLGDKNHNRIKDLMVKFAKSAFSGDLRPTGKAGKYDAYFTVEGKTTDGRCFAATGTVKAKVKVKVKVKAKPKGH
jgi:hypothetical protein